MPNLKQTIIKNERIQLIEDLLFEGLTTTREIVDYINKLIAKNPESPLNFNVQPLTLERYICEAKKRAISKSKPNYLLLSSVLNKKSVELMLKSEMIGDNKTMIDAIDRIAKLNGLYDVELMKKLKWDDILKQEDAKEKSVNPNVQNVDDILLEIEDE